MRNPLDDLRLSADPTPAVVGIGSVTAPFLIVAIVGALFGRRPSSKFLWEAGLWAALTLAFLSAISQD
jgi:hypothetical protein